MQGWGEFAAAMAAFLVSHMIPARPALRRRLVDWLGLCGYIVAYSLLSLAILYWLLMAAARAPYVALWDFAAWQTWVPNLVMPFVVVLAALAVGAPNPLSFGGAREAAFDPERPGIAGVVRHPLLWALLLWSAAHAVPNGDLAHVIMFGLFAALSAGGMVLVDRRKRRLLGDADWQRLARHTSLWPFAAMVRGAKPSLGGKAWLRVVIALLVYGALVMLHPLVIGVSASPAR